MYFTFMVDGVASLAKFLALLSPGGSQMHIEYVKREKPILIYELT